jgi:ATP-dependent DNA helicase RecQ
LEFMKPTGDCGRCPDCRRRGLTSQSDYPPSPRQVWPISAADTTDLATFARTAKGTTGFAVLTYKSHEAEYLPALASSFARLGVRHFGGFDEIPESPDGEPIFSDAHPLTPSELTPVSSLSVFRVGQTVSRFWNGRRVNERLTTDGRALIDILVVPESTKIRNERVGVSIPALSLTTALELLQRR